MKLLRQYSKAVAALAGSVTPSLVIGFLALAGVHVAPALAAAIVTVLTTVATWAAPANQAPVIWTRTGSVPDQPAP
jgi:hypothetical protein